MKKIIKSSWCSGNHACLTHRRSPVRSWVMTCFWYFFLVLALAARPYAVNQIINRLLFCSLVSFLLSLRNLDDFLVFLVFLFPWTLNSFEFQMLTDFATSLGDFNLFLYPIRMYQCRNHWNMLKYLCLFLGLFDPNIQLFGTVFSIFWDIKKDWNMFTYDTDFEDAIVCIINTTLKLFNKDVYLELTRRLIWSHYRMRCSINEQSIIPSPLT